MTKIYGHFSPKISEKVFKILQREVKHTRLRAITVPSGFMFS